MARILLEHPPVSSPWHLPVGIAWLAAVLEQDGHEVVQQYTHLAWINRVCDAEADVRETVQARKFAVTGNNVEYVHWRQDGRLESLLQELSELNHDSILSEEFAEAVRFSPDLYGISISDERQLFPGLIRAAHVKAVLPNTLVVVGGNFWARMGDSLWKHPRISELFKHLDCIVYGEGFEPIRSLAREKNSEQAPATIWWDTTTGTLRRNSLPASPVHFDMLPTPVFASSVRQWSKDVVLPLYTMSNCPQQCAFCAIAAGSDTFLGRPRAMTPRRIAEHMAVLHARHNAYRFDITDETFGVKRQIEVGRELRRIGFKAEWQCYLTADNRLIDPRVGEELYAAGCRAVQIGLESLSMETLTQERKAWNHPENYGAILRNLRAAGIQTHVFIIVGLPGEPLQANLRWLPFLEEYGKDILTIKASRYRVTRRSPEEMESASLEFIDVLPDTRPLHLNRDFNYRGTMWSNKRVNAMRDLLEEACRRHWAYGVTSAVSWWANRGQYTWEQLEVMAKKYPPPSSVQHLGLALDKASTIASEVLGHRVSLGTYDEALAIGRKV